MNLTSEQIERLRVRFEAWWKPQVTEENFGGFSKYDEQRAWQGYLALASAMLGEESIERAAVAATHTMFAQHELPVSKYLMFRYRDTARVTLLAAMGLGE